MGRGIREWKVGVEGVFWRHDTDLLVGVVTLARMVKLLLTVRRLANTWGGGGTKGWMDSVGGVGGEREEGGRDKERGRKQQGGVCVCWW